MTSDTYGFFEADSPGTDSFESELISIEDMTANVGGAGFTDLRGTTNLIPEFFLFSFQTDLAGAIPVERDVAIVNGVFRHFSTTSIEIGVGGGAGALNLGFRLHHFGHDGAIFEDRARFNSPIVQAGQWTPCQLKIPADLIEFGLEYRLSIDVVREQEYWFSNRGGEKVDLSISFSNAELQRRENIIEAQIPTLENSLATAFARIAELEHSERMLLLERDQYKSEASNLGRRLSGNLGNIGLMSPPAAIAGEMLRAFNPVQRRDRWLDLLTSIGVSGALFGMYPHNSGPGPLQILVHGSGGYGDMIYLSVIVRELREHFGDCDIYVMHEHPRVDTVFANNPHVTAAISMTPSQRWDFLRFINASDMFDLIAEVKYVVTYSIPPLSRVPMSFQTRATYTGAEWQKYVRYDWPHQNNLFANAVTARGLSQLDLVGLTSLLPISRHSDIDLFVSEGDMRILDQLVGKDFVTVHHGADRNMAAGMGLQTKNLSTKAWVEIVKALRDAGLTVVQLGEQHEILVTGVDVDLRGQTSLLETAFLIKTARVHVDTEGGLVHVARSVNTPSVVAFGPTPVGFFGYPHNENIPPKLCGNCWWVTKRWAMECPRDLAPPECMESHDPLEMARRAIALAGRNQGLRLKSLVNFGQDPANSRLSAVMDAVPHCEGSGLILIAPDQDHHEVLHLALKKFPSAIVLVVAEKYMQFQSDFGQQILVKPYSHGNIPLATGKYDWAVGVGMDIRNERGLHLAVDLRRTVRQTGPCYVVAANLSQPINGAEWMRHIHEASGRVQGKPYRLEVEDDAVDDLTNYLLVRVDAIDDGV